MNELTSIEIEEIVSYIEHTDDMSVNGRNITCFKDIYCLVTGENVSISNARILDLHRANSITKRGT